MHKASLRPIAGIVLGLTLALPTLAFAHSRGETTSPADGAVLASAPDTIEMRFDMPMRFTLIKLTDATGAEHAVVRTDNMQPVTAIAVNPASPLTAGQYTMEWRGLSADGHPMSGQFTFEVTG